MRLAAPAGVPAAPARVVVLATVRGPAAPASTAEARARCPAAMTPSGGGISTTLIGGGTPPSSLHADGSAPVGSTGGPPLVSGATAAGWAGLGATGGQIVLAGASTAVAVCLSGAGPATIVAATVPGPAVAATTSRATASCPPGRALLGGGGLATVLRGSASPSLHLIGSYPSAADGTPATGTAGSWSALADAGGRTGSGVQTEAFAVCAAATHGRTSVAVAGRAGPLAAGTATRATASCPSATVLVSGGARTGPATGAPQQGLHLTGSFPSNATGDLVGTSANAAGADAWTARAESGGQGSPAGTVTTAFALCLAP